MSEFEDMRSVLISAEMAAIEEAYSALSGADFDEVSIAVRRAIDAYRNSMPTIHVVFDEFPSPKGSRFIEVERDGGFSMDWGEWMSRDDGLVELVFPK